ncbi:hypothetical protein OG21DRAFT_1504843 [Imleria badia]|nr:hypothetical protein OG21DRAFT_1504843 [Imleria badia]
MSTLPQLRHLSTSSPHIDMAFDEDLRLPKNHGDLLKLWMPTPATENHQPCPAKCSISEKTRSFYDTQSPWHASQVDHHPGVLTSTHATNIQVPYNLGLWNPYDLQPVGEVLSTPAVNEGHGNHVMSVSYPAYDPGQNATQWDSHTAFDPLGTLWPTSSDRQLLFPLIEQGSSTLHHCLDQSCAHPSHACSSHATHSHYPCSEPSIPLHTSYQSFSSTSLHFSPHPTPTGFLETISRSQPPFSRVHQSSAGSAHHPACAIEYDGLWIDQEEFLQARMEPGGKLTVHQCRWEEDHSPCRLWIKGDKSYIKAHIQKWHGGKPGGDKLRVDCRWCACGKTMLKESVTRHIASIHLGEKWECQGCGKEFVRSDAYGLHAKRSDFDTCRTSGARITYSGDARVIDAHAALESGGRLRNAGA